MNITNIQNVIQTAIDSATLGDTVTVIGEKTDAVATITLNIPVGVTVVWRAASEGLSFDIDGGGTFEVSVGGKIDVEYKDAITVLKGNVIVSGGEVSTLQRNGLSDIPCRGIYVADGDVTVTGGKVTATGKSSTFVGGVVKSGGAIGVGTGNIIVSGNSEVSALRLDVNDLDYQCALFVGEGSVTVTGGKISASRSAAAIHIDWGDVKVTGGTISVMGETVNGMSTNKCYGIRIENEGTVAVTGGTVSASGADPSNSAIDIGWGLVAYYKDTCIGDIEIWEKDYGIVVEVNSLTIPSSHHGTTNGLTRMEGVDLSYVNWDTSGIAPLICFACNGFSYSIPWTGTSPVSPVEYPVRLKENGNLFKTLNDGIAAASLDFATFTLEVIGDVIETSEVNIGSEKITIVGAEGEHTVTLASSILIQGSGSLTLGDLTLSDYIGANLLTVIGSVIVTDGTINIYNGIKLSSGVPIKLSQIESDVDSDPAPLSESELQGRELSRREISSGSAALFLSGPNANGAIHGGRIEGSGFALSMEKGAMLSEISGGVFTGRTDVVHLTDVDTEIELISGGKFYQTDAATTLHGHAIFVQNDAQIGKISGGYFDAVRNNALALTRGGKVGEISGGEFVVHRTGTIAKDNRNAAVWIENGWKSEGFKGTGIETISGGSFIGTNFGLLSADADNSYSYIKHITGGLFKGTVALQNDFGSIIDEISGGEFVGSQGILNEGEIGKISGTADILGEGSYGIYNYYTNSTLYGTIGEISGNVIITGKDQAIANAGKINLISGGTIVSNTYHGVTNRGVINTISGGTIIGAQSAIFCYTLAQGMAGGGVLATISGGVFWGKSGTTILLSSSLMLEPGLSANIGKGRYQSGNGQIFNDEALVVYPTGYKMSSPSQTLPVIGINDVNFRYLTPDDTSIIVDPEYFYVTYNGNGFTGGSAPVDSKNPYVEDSKVTVLGQGSLTKKDHIFLGWSQSSTATTATFVAGSTFTITSDVVLYAVWAKDAYTVTYAPGAHGTFTAKITSGLHIGDPTPTAPTVTGETGWQFTGWTPTPTTTVTGDTTYTAQWTQTPTTTTPTPTPTPTPPTTSPTPPPTIPSTTAPTTSPIVTTPPPTTTAPQPPTTGEGNWALVNLILSIVGIILAAITTIRALLLKNKKDDENMGEDKHKQKNIQGQQQHYKTEQTKQGKQEKYLQRRTAWLIAAITLSIIGIIVFLITENWHLPRTWVDKWTIINTIILIAEITTIIPVFKYQKTKTNNKNPNQTNPTPNTL
jgi:hypothetical protein